MSCGCSSHNGFLTRAGLAQAKLEQGPELAGAVAARYLDKVVSVSALDRDRDLYAHISDVEIDNQYQRFLNGS